MVELDETTVLLIAFVVLLVPFPMTSVGTTTGMAALWWLGLALLIIGGVVPPISRYVFEDEEDEDDGEDSPDEGDGAQGEDGSSEESTDEG